ncbi:DNA-binding response regulator, partial [Nocardiopsis alba]
MNDRRSGGRVLLVEPESEQSHRLVLSLSGHDVDITVCVD